MTQYARISEALRALVFEPDPGVGLSQVLDRYYAPDYTHRSDGKTLNRDEFTQMVEGIRSQVAGGTVTVLDELRDGSSYAERHVFHITLKNGVAQHREVAIFGSFAEDGRFRNLSETGFDIDPDQTR
ncbi:nuclear transport factor 2 family protein [Streptomyces sp. E5N91]|uniref:nuclear transport factor 2 family protein n=1 Tax=Streptomyces sp. E5N91 TaxID=1851996 RepID=UPI000EF5D05C|nr:nuclear transport factor 2 family protein [Streptomyces sp. E5N91]